MALLFCFPCSQGYAQSYEDDYEATQGLDEIRAFNVYNLDAALDLRFQYKDEEEKHYLREGDSQKKTLRRTNKNKRETFEERINLSSYGSIYHPNLAEFHLDASIGLRQEDREATDSDRSENERLHEGDFELIFLKQKKFNFSFFSSKHETIIDREFYETIDVDIKNFGANFMYQDEIFPMRLSLYSTDMEYDAHDYGRKREEKIAEFEVTNSTNDILESKFDYTYKKIDEKLPTNFQLTRHDFNLMNILDYKNIHGTSNISYYKRSGNIDTDQLQLNESLRVNHSNVFTSFYDYNFGYFKSEGFKSRANYIQTGISHKLYESLVTDLQWLTSHISDNSDFKEFYYGPKLRVTYRKIVPGGRLTAGYYVSYRKTDRESGGGGESGMKKVFGEPIVLGDGRRAVLVNLNIVPESMVIRDENGMILTRGVDYRIIHDGSAMEIRRIGLPENSRISVDYEYEFSTDIKYDTLNKGFNLQYDFRQLFSIYYSRNSVTFNKKTSSLFADEFSLNETKVSLYGAEFKWRWLTILGEYENDSSDIIPFKAWRIRGDLTIYPSSFMTVIISANHTKTDYKKSIRGKVTLDRVSSNLNFRIARFLEADFRVSYLREDGFQIDDRIWKLSSHITSRFRAIELKLEAAYLDRQEFLEDEEELQIKFQLIRYFDII